MDYSLLTKANEDATCKNETLAAGTFSLCGLFNNTLAAHTYAGKYGNVKAANGSSPYSATVSSLEIDNFLFFTFADGALVAFNPNATNCGVGVGNAISTDMITGGKLSNCLGFIDVNGPTPPNKEVQCAEGTTTLSVNTTCKVTNGSMGDIFPIVFHDGAVEPATNAALAAFLGGNGKEGLSGDNDLSGSTGPKKITFKGNEYEYNKATGMYLRKDNDGNYVSSDGKVYTKNSDGNYVNNGIYYDEDMNIIAREENGVMYDYYGKDNSYISFWGQESALWFRENNDGTVSNNNGTVYTKNSDGNYESSYGYVIDENFNMIGRNYKNNYYEFKNGTYIRELENGDIASIDWKTYRVFNKTSDGYYVNNNIYYDKDLNVIGQKKDNIWYDYYGKNWGSKREDLWLHDNGDGTYSGTGKGSIYTKNSDGYWVKNKDGYVFDENFVYIGKN